MESSRIVHCSIARLRPISGAGAPHWNGTAPLSAINPQRIRETLRRLIVPAVKEPRGGYGTWHVWQFNLAHTYLTPRDTVVVEVHATAPADAVQAQVLEAALLMKVLGYRRTDVVALIRALQEHHDATKEVFGGCSRRHLCALFGIDPRTYRRAAQQ